MNPFPYNAINTVSADLELILEHGYTVTSQQLDLNNVTLLSNLISKFRKKGETAQAERLHKILGKCVERCPLLEHPEAKEAIVKKFKEETAK